MFQALACEPLHAGEGVVHLSAPIPHQIGVVSSSQELTQKHIEVGGSKMKMLPY